MDFSVATLQSLSSHKLYVFMILSFHAREDYAQIIEPEVVEKQY